MIQIGVEGQLKDRLITGLEEYKKCLSIIIRPLNMLLLKAASNPATHEHHATMGHQRVCAHARSEILKLNFDHL